MSQEASNEQLSRNFGLHEMLRSQYARRHGGEMLAQQMSPDRQIVRNLRYLTVNTLQPLRTLLKTSMTVTSGYRCEHLNGAIGGSSRSQHMQGMAADVVLSGEFTSRVSRDRPRTVLDHKIKAITGNPIREDVNANFYLFAAACLYAEELDIDQLIHEYGEPGQPDWVHLSSGINTEHRREILVINDGERVKLSLRDALLLGCE